MNLFSSSFQVACLVLGTAAAVWGNTPMPSAGTAAPQAAPPPSSLAQPSAGATAQGEKAPQAGMPSQAQAQTNSPAERSANPQAAGQLGAGSYPPPTTPKEANPNAPGPSFDRTDSYTYGADSGRDREATRDDFDRFDEQDIDPVAPFGGNYGSEGFDAGAPPVAPPPAPAPERNPFADETAPPPPAGQYPNEEGAYENGSALPAQPTSLPTAPPMEEGYGSEEDAFGY